MGLRAVAPPSSRQWGVFRLAANQTTGLAVNNPIRFDTVTAGTLGISGYTILLPAGRIFRLFASLSFSFASNNGSVQAAWFNLTTGQFVGVTSQHIPPTNTTPWSDQPVSHAIVDATASAMSVQLRISAASSPNGVFAGFSFAEVMEIA